MCVLNCPLDIAQAGWTASSWLLFLPRKAPVSIQGLMTHLLCTWNSFSETPASSLSFSMLLILPPGCCPICVPSLRDLVSAFLPGGHLSHHFSLSHFCPWLMTYWLLSCSNSWGHIDEPLQFRAHLFCRLPCLPTPSVVRI